jgi:nanoRNase/pAp phosphatase (c-di-AMP/oligoRNAs hydrolase)
MALPELHQAQTIIERAGNVLLLTAERSSLDAIAAMIALYLSLESNKNDHVDMVNPTHVPQSLQFLPGSSQVKMRPQSRPDVILDIAGTTTINNVRVEPLSGGVRLHIAIPEDIKIIKDQLETSVRSLPYDAALVLGASDLEELGSIFTAHADFFYNTPIINIDRSPDNEHFGTVNLVDITASTVSEVVFELVNRLEPRLDAAPATALYAGIVAGTDSFQRPSTTPQSFKVAAQLLEQKADREAVIRHLVKTKPLSLLKLLGRLYARLHSDEHARILWSTLSATDFDDSGATPDDVPMAIKELTHNVTNFNVLYLLVEKDQQFELLIVLGKGLKKRAREIQEVLAAERDNGLLRLPIPAASRVEAETVADTKVRSILP